MKWLTVAVVLLWLGQSAAQDQATSGDIRLRGLTGTSTPSSGRLEIYLNNAWGTVCAEGFDLYDADTACRELGFLYADRVDTAERLGFGQGTGPIWLTDVECSSFFSRLVDCDRASESTTDTSCEHSQDIALNCSNTPNQLRLVSQTGRNTSLSAGRLEIFINQTWGTVCERFFDISDANVACRQMGLSEAIGFATASDLGYSSQLVRDAPIWLSELDCSSSSFLNDNLRECSHAGTGRHGCDHSQDIILSCLAGGNLRLIADANSQTLVTGGRLEIYLRRDSQFSSLEWGTVCDDTSFYDIEADVACRQLGFTGAARHGTNLGFSPGSPPQEVWLEDVRCRPDDLTLFECTRNPVVSSCSHSLDVQLQCSVTEESQINTGALIGGLIGGVTFIGVCFGICIGRCVCKKKSRNNSIAPPPPRTTTVVGSTTPDYPRQQWNLPSRPATTDRDQEPSNSQQGPSAGRSPTAFKGGLNPSVLHEESPPSYEEAISYPLAVSPGVSLVASTSPGQQQQQEQQQIPQQAPQASQPPQSSSPPQVPQPAEDQPPFRFSLPPPPPQVSHPPLPPLVPQPLPPPQVPQPPQSAQVPQPPPPPPPPQVPQPPQPAQVPQPPQPAQVPQPPHQPPHVLQSQLPPHDQQPPGEPELPNIPRLPPLPSASATAPVPSSEITSPPSEQPLGPPYPTD